jgi:putative DNA primase/helicase
VPLDPAQLVRERDAEATGGDAELSAPTESRHDLSEDQLAGRFTTLYGTHLRYCPPYSTWFHFDGVAFVEDKTTTVFDRARHVARRAAAEAGLEIGNSLSRKVRSAATAAAIVRLAQSDPVHAVEPDALDRDPWLLNTPGGAVDLRTGGMRPNDPADLCTRLAGATPRGDAPRWRTFLEEVTGGDVALIAYLQRLFGYSLTGSTREHALIFVHGPGGTGKSSFLKAMAYTLGTYARTSPISTFTESPHEAHPTELARLKGARLVSANETEEGRRWAEAKIKSLTGGDVIAARFMRADFFEYTPQFKLLVVGNHRPRFRSPDSAIRRRLHLVPFVHKPSAPDPDLDAKLQAEANGILAWAVDGCLAWQREGLNPPAIVQAATDDYLTSEDATGAWLEERTVADAQAWSGSAALFEDWRLWAEARGEFVGSMRRFVSALEDRGFTPAKNPAKTARGLRGLRVRVQLGPLLEQAPDHTRVRATLRNGFTSETTLAEVRQQPELFVSVEHAA